MSRTAPNPNAKSVFDDRDDAERIYFEFVDRASEAAQYRVISNGQPGHAAYLIYTFLKNARERLRLYCGSLRQDVDGVKVYADPAICKEAVSFLARGGKLDVLVEDDIHVGEGQAPRDHPLLAAIIQAGHEGDLTLKRVMNPKPDIHFLVVDESAVRIETDKEKAKALANFHDVQFSQRAIQVFDQLAANAEEIGLTHA